MPRRFAEITFTDSVKAAQTRYDGSATPVRLRKANRIH